MKKLFYPAENVENNIAYCLLIAFLITLPFDRLYSTIVLITFVIYSLIYFNKAKFKFIGKETFILQSVFFVSLIAAFYSTSRGSWDIVTRQLAILLFPLLFTVLSPALSKYRSGILFCFALCCTLIILYLFYDALHVIYHNELPLKTLVSAAFLNHHFSQPINLHATYLSLYVLMSLIYFLHSLLTEQKIWWRVFYICSSIVLTAGLLQLSSRSVLIAFLIIINAAAFFLPVGKQRIFILFWALFVSIAVISLISSSDTLRQRFIVDLTNDFEQRSNITKNDTRLQRWEASYELISHAPLFGHGSGSETPLLKEIYFKRKMYSSYLNEMNVHNEYLSFLINSGFIGLLIYIFTLAWGFWRSFKTNDLLFFSFMIMIAVVSFSENLLQVNKGIFFYGFFFTFFVFFQKK